MNTNIKDAGGGYFALKMVLVGDTKITSKHPLVEKDKEVILVLTESAQFSIETTKKQTVNIVMVGAGQPGTDTTGGVSGEMIEKTIELETGEYYVSIGNPKLHGKTTLASVLDGSKYVFIAARSGTEMNEVLERKEINICSIEHCNLAAAEGGVEIGAMIQDSPVGPGKFTDINGRGYPIVNHVTVTNFITEDGIVYGDYVEWIVKKAQKQAKENNMVVQFLYKNPNPDTTLEIKDIGPINDFWYLQGFGPIPDAKFCERYKTPMTWKIDFVRPDKVATYFVNQLIESQKTKEAIAHNWAADTAAAQLKSLMGSEHNLEEMKRSFERTLYVWLKDLHQANRDMEFYRGIVMQTGELLGAEAFTSSDGTVGDSVLALKVPELVKKLVEENNSSKD